MNIKLKLAKNSKKKKKQKKQRKVVTREDRLLRILDQKIAMENVMVETCHGCDEEYQNCRCEL